MVRFWAPSHAPQVHNEIHGRLGLVDFVHGAYPLVLELLPCRPMGVGTKREVVADVSVWNGGMLGG